jgi:hypothetical protein
MKKISATQKNVLKVVGDLKTATVEAVVEKMGGVPKIAIQSSLKSLVSAKALSLQNADGVKTYKIVEIPHDVDVKERTSKEKTPAEEVEAKEESKKKPSDAKRDFTRYKFGGVDSLSKGRLILAMVTEHVAKNKNTSYAKLKEIFPDELIPTYGVFQELAVAKKRSADRPRFFLKTEETIKLKDKTIAVTNQVTGSYLESFLAAAKKVGLKAQTA